MVIFSTLKGTVYYKAMVDMKNGAVILGDSLWHNHKYCSWNLKHWKIKTHDMHFRFYSSRMIAIFFFQLVMFQQQHIFKVSKLSKVIIINVAITHPTCAAIF